MRAQFADRVFSYGKARQEIFWLKLMIKSWKSNISFHASRETEFKEIINGVKYQAINFWKDKEKSYC